MPTTGLVCSNSIGKLCGILFPYTRWWWRSSVISKRWSVIIISDNSTYTMLLIEWHLTVCEVHDHLDLIKLWLAEHKREVFVFQGWVRKGDTRKWWENPVYTRVCSHYRLTKRLHARDPSLCSGSKWHLIKARSIWTSKLHLTDLGIGRNQWSYEQ